MLFAIRNGKLVPTNSDFEDFYDVRNALGYVDAGEPARGEIAVVVADASQPLRRVPRNAVTVTTVSEPNEDVYLFWAVNEDDSNKEVIVAFDNYDIANNYDDLWRIISFDEWVQLPLNKELIRAFQSVEEARACIHDDGMVFVPIAMNGGWQGVTVHGTNSPMECDGIRCAVDRRLVEMIPIPTGWEVRSMLHEGEITSLQNVLSESESEQLSPELKNADLVRVVITLDGGAAVIAHFQDGEIGGVVTIGRTFTHEEAKTMLTL